MATSENRQQRSERKRQEAEERQAHWEKLTPQQKLSELSNRPGNCEKQIKRIKAQMKSNK